MATIVQQHYGARPSDERFFLHASLMMGALILCAFAFTFAMGRSTLASPLRVHLHAVVFMGWVAIYVLQNILVATDRIQLHRKLGWVAAAWMVPMLVLGFWVTIVNVRQSHFPFFFQPLHFLVFDPVTLLAFAGLTSAAIVLRRRTDWHRRLHFCGMSLLMGPAFGRLLPMPLLIPWAWEASFAASLLFPIAGVVADVRRSGAAHHAWRWGIGTMLTAFVLIEAVTYSPVGLSIYRAVTAGSSGATLNPLGFGAPPAGR